jgi:hypothetical protein
MGSIPKRCGDQHPAASFRPRVSFSFGLCTLPRPLAGEDDVRIRTSGEGRRVGLPLIRRFAPPSPRRGEVKDRNYV